MSLRPRLPADLEAVQGLLAVAGLPSDNLPATRGWVALREGRLVGHVALEEAADGVILQALAVAAEARGTGLGRALLDRAEAALEGRPAFARTDTIGPWLRARGWQALSREAVPPGVAATRQFAGARCAQTPIFARPSGAPMATSSPIHDAVRTAYGRIAQGGGGCCGPVSSCCGGDRAEAVAQGLGYDPADLSTLPEGANLGLSCGNPTALAELKPGEVVLDLGSGAGLDVFLAAPRVGPTGHAHGVDMTREMVARARQNAATFRARTGLDNVTFHHAQIEAIPLPEVSVDVVLSNCVLNLSPDQPAVWREIARVLKPGGRVAISDMVLLRPLPEALRASVEARVGCIAGAPLQGDLERMVAEAGLVDLRLEARPGAVEAMLPSDDPLAAHLSQHLPEGTHPSDLIASMAITARKPR